VRSFAIDLVRELITIIDTREKGFDCNGRDREQILSPASDIKLTQRAITEIEYVPAE
jgi:hypothetical protein